MTTKTEKGCIVFFISAQKSKKKTDHYNQSFSFLSCYKFLRKDIHKFQIREGKGYL